MSLQNLRELFIPSQPAINYNDSRKQRHVVYQEKEPEQSLQPFIYCYWQLYTKQPLPQAYVYRVVSDGCIDILWEQQKRKDVFITGFSTSYLEYNLGQSFCYNGIRFLPGGFPSLFDISAEKLTNNFIRLNNIFPYLDSKIESATKGISEFSETTTVLNNLFLKLLNSNLPLNTDQRFQKAFLQILEARGNIRLKTIDAGISERQLRRLFQFYFGESPKTFAKILRFQNILHSDSNFHSIQENTSFFDEGYYDQAHFIKEFKAFYGVTPSKALGKK